MTEPRFHDVSIDEFQALLDTIPDLVREHCIVCYRRFADDELSALVLDTENVLGLIGECCRGSVAVYFRLKVRVPRETALAIAESRGRA
jgi:hypothetical protein